MKELLLRLVDWYLARRFEYREAQSVQWLAISQRVDEIAAAAAPLIEQIDTKPFRGGYKRRRVEAQLFRLYPADAKTDIALAVEVAIRRMRGL